MQSQRPVFEPVETDVPEGERDRRLLKKVLKFALSDEVSSALGPEYLAPTSKEQEVESLKCAS